MDENIFIDDETPDEGTLDFYRRVDKKILLAENNSEPTKNIGRLRIESEKSDGGFYDNVSVQNFEPPSDSDDDEIQIPEKELRYYGTDLKEWESLR